MITHSVFCQTVTQGVNFKNIDINTALKLASYSNKAVFCNFSTSWCGPCKQMKKNIYTDSEVGKIMNDKFISLYIDSESQAWKDIAKKMNINAYPTMVILDSKGQEIHRMKGSMPKNILIKEIESIFDESKKPNAIKDRYNSGERTPELIDQYTMYLMRNIEEEKGYAVVNNYFDSLSKSQKTSKENWFIYKTYALNLNDKKAAYFVDNYKDFYATIGKETTDLQVYKYLKSEIGGYISGYYCTKERYNKNDYNYIKNKINSVDIPQKHFLESCIKISDAYIKAEHSHDNKYLDFIKVCETEFDKLERVENFIMINNFSYLVMKASDKAKVKAAALIEKYKIKYSALENKNSYKRLDRIIEDLTPVKRGDIINFSEISYEESLKQANKKEKLIFIDCYTSWCGPCKKLSKEVFTAKPVKKYFDNNFINLKIDMEKGEGPKLSKQFGISSYPTLLLIDSDGNIVAKKIGAPSVNDFLEFFTTENEKYKKTINK